MQGGNVFLGILFIFSPFFSPLHAVGLYQDELLSLDLKGYYKNLAFVGQRATTGAGVFADLNRIRTEWDASFHNAFSAKLIWDNELIYGDYVRTEEFSGRQSQRNKPFPSMNYELIRKRDFFYGQQFYRAYMKLDPGPFELTVGRQLVDWGVMRFFSPLDLFTPLNIFDIEREERVGTTATNLLIPIGSAMKINPVLAIDPQWARCRLGGRLMRTVGRFDLSILGGKFLEDQAFGFDFSGDIQKAGIRGELLYDRAKFGSDFVQGALGADYGFESSLELAAEYFFNGQGTNHTATAGSFLATANQLQTVYKNFFTVHAKYDLSPLWTILFDMTTDINGRSVFMLPETQYALFESLQLALGALLPAGRTGGEFTAVPSSCYLRAQFFF